MIPINEINSSALKLPNIVKYQIKLIFMDSESQWFPNFVYKRVN